jgi:hypothetical protein
LPMGAAPKPMSVTISAVRPNFRRVILFISDLPLHGRKGYYK